MDFAELGADFGSQRVRVAPVLEVLRLGSEQGVEVTEAEATDVSVLRRGDDTQAVDPDLQLDVVDPVLLAGRGLLLLDGARGIADSISPAQKRANPSPVPGPSTE